MLTKDQQNARNLIIDWITKRDDPFFVLAGYAGTGKTFLMKLFVEEGIDIIFSATTNKAAKVLSITIGKDSCTIHSILNLTVKEKEENLILSKGPQATKLLPNSIICVDEASMIGPELFSHILSETKKGMRFIFVGDPAQLPPVNETESPVWDLLKNENCSAKLLEVVRNDNQLLNVATKIRKCIQHSYYNNPIINDYDGSGGVRLFSTYKEFQHDLLKKAKNINFEDTRIIAWRNKTVDHYNLMIRKTLGFQEPWVKGEIILSGSPIIRDNKVVSSTDDEFVITEVYEGSVILDDFKIEIDVWELKVDKLDGIIRIPRNKDEVDNILNRQATKAKLAKKNRGEEWKKYWRVKKIFDDIRYTYAITAHKAQGTTLKECYIDSQDILSNSNTKEAFRCLYVAATRPTQTLYTY